MQSQHKFLFALTLRIGADENSRFSSLGNYVGFSRAALFLACGVRPSDCARIAEAAESSVVPVRPPARVRVRPSIVGREGTTRKSDSVVRSSFLWCDLPIVRPRPSVRPSGLGRNKPPRRVPAILPRGLLCPVLRLRVVCHISYGWRVRGKVVVEGHSGILGCGHPSSRRCRCSRIGNFFIFSALRCVTKWLLK